MKKYQWKCTTLTLDPGEPRNYKAETQGTINTEWIPAIKAEIKTSTNKVCG